MNTYPSEFLVLVVNIYFFINLTIIQGFIEELKGNNTVTYFLILAYIHIKIEFYDK